MARSRPTMNLLLMTTESSSTAQSSNTPGSPGTLRASSQSLCLLAGTGRLVPKIQIKMTQRRGLKCSHLT